MLDSSSRSESNIYSPMQKKDVNSFFVKAESPKWICNYTGEGEPYYWGTDEEIKLKGTADLRVILSDNPVFNGKPVEVLQIMPLDKNVDMALVELRYKDS